MRTTLLRTFALALLVVTGSGFAGCRALVETADAVPLVVVRPEPSSAAPPAPPPPAIAAPSVIGPSLAGLGLPQPSLMSAPRQGG